MKHFRPGLKPDHTRVWSGTLHTPGITSWHDDNEFLKNIDHRYDMLRLSISCN